MPTVAEIAQSSGFKGSGYRRTAEPAYTQFSIDNSLTGGARAVSSSVDCYVAGTYVGRKGKTLEVFQRYRIFVRYDASTQKSTMADLRSRIMGDFSQKYGQFNITTVFIPDVPVAPDVLGDQGFYGGEGVWRSRIQRASFEIGTEREKARLNVSSIKRRYNIK